MPEEYTDKRLAMAAGLGKGISAWIKGQQEAKIKQQGAESQMLRQLLPQLFMQKRFEQEQKQEWTIAQQRQELELGKLRIQQTESAIDVSLKLNEMDLAIEDFRLKRENYERTWELDREKFDYTKQQDYMKNAIDLLGQNTQILIAHAGNMTTLATQGTAEQKQQWAKELDSLQFEHNKMLETLRQTFQTGEAGLRRTFEETQAELGRTFQRGMAGERTVQDKIEEWRSDVIDLQTKSPSWAEYRENPKNLQAANEVKIAIDALEARRLEIPADVRPSVEELPLMQLGEQRRLKKDIPSELAPRLQSAVGVGKITTASDVINNSVIENKAAALQAIEALKGKDAETKARLWQQIYSKIKGKLSEEQIAIIEKELGLQ